METDLKYPVSLTLRIDWSELDLFGHVNNVMIFKYIQASRVNYWDVMGLSQQFSSTRIGPILANTTCKFIKPLHYPGKVTIKASVTFIKNTSFGISHRLFNENNELVAEAEDVVVQYNFNTNEKTQLTEALRKEIEKIEERKF